MENSNKRYDTIATNFNLNLSDHLNCKKFKIF